MKNNINNGGFTIVETLVAITVLMIAIAGPLVVASKGLRAAVYARNQMIASYLAQESIEMIKNMRDNNLALNGPDHWLDNPYDMTGCVRNGVGDTTTCDASGVDSMPIVSCLQAACPLYLVSDGYGHGPGSTAAGFSRYFYLTPVSADKEVRATVVVSWNDGVISNEVEVSSQLLNTSR
ncbi:MAG: hypothetical protein A3D50_00025 [Candidatus Taylorbacteria bacterium RIFCSPHIGHO2_02_FULL_44_12]|uniref:Type II secretion system protein GspI C-terminal domain-containing protein n=1 Tax=Candidatus Taylorbacteria bacterium RIFCSPHIGHO2_02_FULL_44_12 TaxID=1802308 RepID=A0A1G2MKD6_9BACT|nr:MAG: hypothetical protein A3D50_00025 [Candidatus Taylorbacteria bacterium RIFCSPHIGHO2_02_FULL_44_12]